MVRVVIAALLLGSCTKVIEGSCASDDECAVGVRCDLTTHRCAASDGGVTDGDGVTACVGAVPGDDDPACGTVDCDGLDDACRDFADVTAARCAGDGACKPANDPGTCTVSADLCAPFGCDESGAAPACRTWCETAGDCAPGLGCPAGRCCDGGWQIFTVDSAGDVGSWARIAMAHDGNAHGAWIDATNGAVRVGSNSPSSPGVWSVSQALTGVRIDGDALSLAVDAAGARHLMYQDAVLFTAYHSIDDGSGWVSISLGQQNVATLAVAPNGLAHALTTTADMKYRFRTAGGATNAACSVDGAGSLLAATVDPAGRAYFTQSTGLIRYGAQSSACNPDAPTATDCCDFTVVDAAVGDSTPDPMARHAIAYDSAAGQAHITYYISATGDLRHAICDDVSCSNEDIATQGDVGRYSSIVVGAGGLHVVYYDATNGDLRYATNVRGSWETLVIDSAGDVGAFASLARGPDGGLHALYYDADAQDAKYATLPPACVPGE